MGTVALTSPQNGATGFGTYNENETVSCTFIYNIGDSGEPWGVGDVSGTELWINGAWVKTMTGWKESKSWSVGWILQPLTEYTIAIAAIVIVDEQGSWTRIFSATHSFTTIGPPANVRSIHQDSVGVTIVAAAEDGIYISFDSGDNWAKKLPDGVAETDWEKVICSYSGVYIIAVSSANAIYRSATGGAGWAAITPAGGDTFSVNKLAMSDDGQFIVIVGQNSTDSTKSCYISVDYGATWTAKNPTNVSVVWTDCAISNDGTAIGVSTSGYFEVSFDSGTTWRGQTVAATTENWGCLGISGDGSKGLVANLSDNNEFFIGTKTETYSEATWAESDLTSAGRALLDDANAAAQATTLGLGTGDAVTHDTLTLSSTAAEGTDVDKFLVDSTGVVKYRTGAEVLSDIGASASAHLHDTQTLEHDAVNSDGGAFSFTTTGTVTFNQSIAAANYAAVNLLTAAATNAGELDFTAASKKLDVEGNAVVSQDYTSDASPQFTGLTLSGLTQGSVIFAGASGVISQDNSNLFWDDTNNRLGIGTTAPNAPLEVKGAKPGVVGDYQSGQLQVTGSGGEFYCAVITGHNAFNGNTQLWYLGNTSSSSHNDVAFINRQNAPIHFYTNNTSRMTIDAAGNVTLAIIAAEGSDVDKFLVSSSGVVKYRTGTQVLSDIGGSASGHNHSGVYEPADAGLTSLAGLGYVSDSMIKITAEDTYAIRTLAEVKTDLSLNNVENTAHSTDAHTMSIDGRDVSVDGTKLDGIEALADVTATAETSHADVLQDGDFSSNGLMERTGAGSYGIKAIGTDVQAWDAGLDSLAALSYVSASFVKMTGANTFALRTLQQTSDDLEATIDHDNLLNFAANEHYLQSAITEVGTIATGTWQATDVGIGYGGTGQSTAQLAINALTAVSGATNEYVLTKDTATGNAIFKAAAGGGSGYLGYIKLSDVKAPSTEGGTFTSGAWRTRVLTTEDSDTNNDCVLNANQITLDAGTYECSISCPAFEVDDHQARLYNTTGETVILIGTSEFTRNPSAGASRSFIVGRFTIAADQALEIQHRCDLTHADHGLGLSCDYDVSEIYTIAEFRRVS